MSKQNKQKKYYVAKSFVGEGLFANCDFVKDDFIIRYTGDELTHEEADKKGGKYLFILNKKVVLDGTDKKYTARYINHSCDPNIEAIIEDEEQIMFYALCDIKKGEEFTFDYGEEYVNDIINKIGCCCNKCKKNKNLC